MPNNCYKNICVWLLFRKARSFIKTNLTYLSLPLARVCGEECGGLQQQQWQSSAGKENCTRGLYAFVVWPRASRSAALGLSYHIHKVKCLVTFSPEFLPRPKLEVWTRSVSFNKYSCMLQENM